MADDSYTQWLGIAPGQRPPDHYTLLGLPRFTHAEHAIEAAARAQLDRLDQYAIHPDREKRDAATGMMNEVASARIVLADSNRRAQYDQELAERLGIAAPQPDSSPDMAETIVGQPAMVSSALDVGAVGADQPGSAELPDQAGPQSLFEEQAPLQDVDPTFEPPRSRHTMIPFSVVLLLGGLGVALVVGLVVISVILFSERQEPRPAPSQPEPSSIVVPKPPPAPKRPRFFDGFKRSRLRAAYEIGSGSKPHVAVTNGKLVLSAVAEKLVQVDLIPRRDNKRFREATIEVEIDKGTQFSFGIHTVAKLTVSRTDKGIDVRAEPGSPVETVDSDGWPRLADTNAMSIRLHRKFGTVIWEINGQEVATSLDIEPRGELKIRLEVAGVPDRHVAIDSIDIWYDAKKQ